MNKNIGKTSICIAEQTLKNGVSALNDFIEILESKYIFTEEEKFLSGEIYIYLQESIDLIRVMNKSLNKQDFLRACVDREGGANRHMPRPPSHIESTIQLVVDNTSKVK